MKRAVVRVRNATIIPDVVTVLWFVYPFYLWLDSTQHVPTRVHVHIMGRTTIGSGKKKAAGVKMGR